MVKPHAIPRAGLALMALVWSVAAAPTELTGTYIASTEFIAAPSRETTTRPGAMLELRLTISESGGALSGFLDAQVQHSLLRFAFPITGSQRSERLDLAVQVNLCLERPLVRLAGAVGRDHTITFAPTAQTITCNFAQVYLQLPKTVRLALLITAR